MTHWRRPLTDYQCIRSPPNLFMGYYDEQYSYLIQNSTFVLYEFVPMRVVFSIKPCHKLVVGMKKVK